MTAFSPSRRQILFAGAGGFALAACGQAALAVPPYRAPAAGRAYANSLWRTLTEAQWRQRLSPAAFEVLRHEDTERPGTSPLTDEKRQGLFLCAGCALPLFSSKTIFHSGTGWPSFYAPLKGAIETKSDYKIGLERVEYHCAQCLGHQGHVFEDGPPPTGLRYCNNGVALTFAPGRTA
jgi:peptide-methionine (R)-S-oxide reductase